jgi:peptidoglycan hydrolase-like protein with peptidoglycan-binding domain
MSPSRRILIIVVGVLTSALAMAAGEMSTPAAPETQSRSQPISKTDLTPVEIRKLQTALNEAGYDAGPVDGVWGGKTDEALRDFKKAKELEPNAVLDDNTILALGFSRGEFQEPPSPEMLSKSDVRQVQEALNKEGYSVGAVDGVWGPATASALRNYQEAKGLEPTGRLDHDTVLALGLSTSEFAAGEFKEEPSDTGQ